MRAHVPQTGEARRAQQDPRQGKQPPWQAVLTPAQEFLWTKRGPPSGERQCEDHQLNDAPGTGSWRQIPGPPAMCNEAGQDGDESSQDEGGVSGAAEQIDAGRDVEGELEEGRVVSERIKQHDDGKDGESADLGAPEDAAEGADDHERDRKRAEVKDSHVAREKEINRTPAGARWPPIDDKRTI